MDVQKVREQILWFDDIRMSTIKSKIDVIVFKNSARLGKEIKEKALEFR